MFIYASDTFVNHKIVRQLQRRYVLVVSPAHIVLEIADGGVELPHYIHENQYDYINNTAFREDFVILYNRENENREIDYRVDNVQLSDSYTVAKIVNKIP